MATQLLIYESVVPVSSARHASYSVQANPDYGFARKVNSLPLTAIEFLEAAQEYPVVFAGDGKVMTPSVVLGLRERENVFVDAKGVWSARYIPAFARRYPFVFSTADDGGSFTLCIDESCPGLNTEDRGERLFDQLGKQTPYVDNVLKFLQQYQLEFQRTQELCRRLTELDLFEPMQAQIKLGGTEEVSLRGFKTIDRGKLKALPGEILAELVRKDALELIYAHLNSLRHFASIRERLLGAAAAPGKSEKPARGGSAKESGGTRKR